MFKRMTALTLAMVLCAGSAAMAQDGGNRPKSTQPGAKEPSATLQKGDKAPALSVEDWIKGDKVESFESGKVYVVEFWATWCGPCVKNIPHLTEIQKKYKNQGVTIIGVAASEKEGSEDQNRSKVKNFVKGRNKEIGYTIAFDADRSMSRDWMQAAGQRGIPAAFIVGKDGKIAWIGHPGRPEFESELKKAIGDRADAGAWSPITLASYQPAGKEKQPEKAKEDEKKKEKKEQGPTLKLGDKAPPLAVSKFVKGDPVTGFEKGTAYVIEFWATWCGPCKTSIPHITELQKEHKDEGLKVIGVSIWESDPSAVEPFVEEMGDKMDYIVAMDKLPEFDPSERGAARKAGSEGEMATKWMKAAGRNGIPTSFIVDREGRIAWIGHPMNMDEPLNKVLKGEWDIEKEKAREQRAKEAETKMRPLMSKLQTAMQQEDYDTALHVIDEIIELDEANAERFGSTKFLILLREMKDYDRAYAYGNQLVDGALKNSSMGLNELAWRIVDPETFDEIEKKDLKLAMKAAQRANELTKSKDPAIMDTLAAVYHAQGDLNKALEWQRKAVEQSEGTQFEEELKNRLDQYEEEAKKKG